MKLINLGECHRLFIIENEILNTSKNIGMQKKMTQPKIGQSRCVRHSTLPSVRDMKTI